MPMRGVGLRMDLTPPNVQERTAGGRKIWTKTSFSTPCDGQGPS